MHIFSDLTMYKRMRIAFLPGGSDIHIGKRLLVPRNFGKKQHPQMLPFGADDGNRTHTTSLEGWSSTTKLHLQDNCLFKSAYIL